MGDLSKMRGVFSVLLGLLVSSVLSRLSYDSYSVLRVNVENEAQAELLLQLEEQGGFDFWSEVGLGRPLDVMTAPETKETLTLWQQARHVDRQRNPRQGVDLTRGRNLDAQRARGE